MRGTAAVRESIERWEASGLLDASTAEGLHEELAAHAEQERLRFSRLLLAATAAVVLLIAAGTFTAWIWPGLGVGARCLLIGGVGLLLAVAGARLEQGARREVGCLLQTSGLLLVAIACGYSAEQWPNGSPAGQLAGGLALFTGIASFAYSVRRSVVMPAVTLLLGYVFLAVFAMRAFPEGSADILIWACDALFALEAVLLLASLASSRAPPWVGGAAGALVCIMPVLIVATVLGPLNGDGADTAWPLDAWLIGVTALLLWLRARMTAAGGQDRTPLALGLVVLIGVGLAFHTTLNAASAPPEVAALAVAGLGALALAFAVPRGERDVLVAGALALVVAAWYYATERGEAVSAFLALGFTAAVLFWVATRVGRGRQRTVAGGPSATT